MGYKGRRILNNNILNNITVITVTYGKRWHLLKQVLSTVLDQGIKSVVVVDNGSQESIANNVLIEFGPKIHVVTLSNNFGSAYGFKIGILKACDIGAEYLWILDDDNLPQPGAVCTLIEAYRNKLKIYALNELAVFAFRADHQAEIAAGVPLNRCYPRPGNFLGFHIFDVPYKIWKRSTWGKPKRSAILPESIEVPHAPYSGFFCNNSVINKIGLPDTEMVLYADDTEFTSRLTKAGGYIFLIPSSRIEDLEKSWITSEGYNNTFLAWLFGSGDFRAFYVARNLSYLESRNNNNKMLHNINKYLYLFVLAILSILFRRYSRYLLIIDAIKCGESEIMGIDNRFKLY